VYRALVQTQSRAEIRRTSLYIWMNFDQELYQRTTTEIEIALIFRDFSVLALSKATPFSLAQSRVAPAVMLSLLAISSSDFPSTPTPRMLSPSLPSSTIRSLMKESVHRTNPRQYPSLLLSRAAYVVEHRFDVHQEQYST